MCELCMYVVKCQSYLKLRMYGMWENYNLLILDQNCVLLCTCAHRYLSIIFDHNVAIVSVSYAQDKCGYTVACTRPCEQIYGLVVPKKSNKEKILYLVTVCNYSYKKEEKMLKGEDFKHYVFTLVFILSLTPPLHPTQD